jgi:hypothetical protein
MPTMRGRYHDDAASGVMPRRANDEAEARRGRRDPDVHRQLHRRADADRGAVDGADDRLEALVHAQRRRAAAVAVDVADAQRLALGVARTGAAVEGRAARRQVGAGAEGAAGAGDDDDANVVVAIGLVEQRRELAPHPRVVGVEPVRAVERDRGDAAVDVVAGGLEGGEGHRGLRGGRGPVWQRSCIFHCQRDDSARRSQDHGDAPSRTIDMDTTTREERRRDPGGRRNARGGRGAAPRRAQPSRWRSARSVAASRRRPGAPCRRRQRRRRRRARRRGKRRGEAPRARRADGRNEATAQFVAFALNALLVPLFDDDLPPRWADPSLSFDCDAGDVTIDDAPLDIGAPVPHEAASPCAGTWSAARRSTTRWSSPATSS